MKENGHYVSIGGQSSKLLYMMLFRKLIQMGNSKRFHMVALKANQGLEQILELYEQGKVTCQVDGPYPFEKIPWAVQRFGDGKHHGKIVIQVG